MANAQWWIRRRASVVASLLFVAASSLPGQTQGSVAPVSGPVARYSNLIFTVGNLETSVAFYRDLVGLEVLSLRRGNSDDKIVGPYVAKVSGSPAGVVFSSAILKLPGAGFNLLMTEFGNVDRTRREANLRDTNTTMLILTVRNLDRPYNALKKAGARIVTKGGSPVDLPDRSRGVVARDVDGFLVQLIQPAHVSETDLPKEQNVVSAHLRITVSRLDETIAFYKNVLGFQFSIPSPGTLDAQSRRLMDVSRTRWRRSTGGLARAEQSIELIDYESGRKRVPPSGRLSDPGTPAFSMSVRNVDALLEAIKANGAPIVSEGAQPIVSPNGGRNVFVRDPDGFFLELEGPLER